jgi:hypothetical protein
VDLAAALDNTEDVTRIVQKLVLGRGEPSDLLAIRTTVSKWSAIQRRVEHEKAMEKLERNGADAEEWLSIDALMARMSNLDGLSRRVSSALRSCSSAPEDGADFIASSDQVPDSELISPSGGNWRYDGAPKWYIKPE